MQTQIKSNPSGTSRIDFGSRASVFYANGSEQLCVFQSAQGGEWGRECTVETIGPKLAALTVDEVITMGRRTSTKDVDPTGALRYYRTPGPYTGSTRVRIRVSAIGDRADAQVAVRWGHPDFHENEYFPLWTIARGQVLEKTFDLPDANSEFEIQTEGGRGTGYAVQVWVDIAGNVLAREPSILLKHNIDGVVDDHVVNNAVAATRSSGLNEYGEQNIRVDTKSSKPGPIK